MKFDVVHPYEARLDTVLDAFFDENHIRAKNERLGHRNVAVRENQRDDSAGKLVVEREMTTSVKVPGALSAFHREWNSVRQEEHWFRKDATEWHCEFRVRIDGVPAKIHGNMQLKGNGAVSANHVSLDVYCDVPFLGKKIAQFLVDDMRYKLEQEYDATRGLLR
ncbi:DUF2505 domain-containing protein [Marinobacter bohaiensis]|uniref:DUF2505 domain-containing protein n=1 Tax=Marinobacter bohaiensis TaxID=2201898 RepID=UPI000DAF28DD|nr:DUF2505 domain-containing protein [Marinobacter bohaiensis]